MKKEERLMINHQPFAWGRAIATACAATMCLALAIVPASTTYADDATAPAQQQTTDNSNNTDTPDNPDNPGKPDNPGADSDQHTDPSNGAIDAFAATHTWLGSPTAEVTPITAIESGAERTYQNGTVYWSSSTGVHVVRSNIDACYQKHLQDLGFPVNDGMKLRGGTSQVFQNGQIHWSPSTGARFTRGAIQQYWSAHGWENGWLGWPTGDELTVKGGASQTFQHGVVFWSNSTGAHAVKGGILGKYANIKYEQGILGFPVNDEMKLRGGASQVFQNGQIHWSPSTGARFTRGAIQQYWSAHGWENGWLGWPTGDELTVKGGASQTFQHGVVFWSNSTGAHAVKGGILGKYANIKYEQGILGFPVNDEMKLRGGASQVFQNGQIHWSPSTGARFTRGAIQQYWSAHGWENGWLGWPTGDELTVKGGASQTFQHGTVFWSPTTGAHPVVGTTLSKYAAARYEQGQYGFPVEDQTGPSQRFQHGSIAGCGKIGYQNPGGFFQVSSCNVSVPGGAFGYASPSRISINANRDQVVNAFISRAYDYLGTRYVWDYAMQPGNGVDCAGLVMQSLYATGMNLQDYNPTAHWYDPWHSHDANNMSNDSRFLHIPVSQRQRGDLIFYPGHVAIYLGNDQVIEAVPPRVRVANMYAGNRHPTSAARPFI